MASMALRSATRGLCQPNGWSGRGGPYYHVLPPNEPGCAIGMPIGADDSFIGPGSFHPGGANLLLMDGSVRYIKSSIAIPLWNALGTPAGSELISFDAF